MPPGLPEPLLTELLPAPPFPPRGPPPLLPEPSLTELGPMPPGFPEPLLTELLPILPGPSEPPRKKVLSQLSWDGIEPVASYLVL